MPKRTLYLISGTILLFLFVCFSFLVHKNVFTHLDFNTTVHVQDHISRRFDLPFSILSSIGQFEFMGIILVVLLCFTKQIRAGIVAVGLFISFHLVEVFGKYFVHHPPPPQFMVRTYNIMQFPQYYVQNLNSYPSGHSGRTLFVAMLALALVWQSRKLGQTTQLVISCFILAFVVTMLVSRIYLGEHWLSDVIGGSLLGGGLGLYACIFLREGKNQSVQEGKKKGFFPKYKIEVKRVA